VEISAKADPPVCKIIDYQKYLYQQKKKAKEMKLNSAKMVVKEIRFGPNTDEHDFQFKLKHAQEFLEDGNKVKASIFFRGRSIQFADQGEKQLLRFAVELESVGRAEHMPILEGKRMSMTISPIKKK
jgi:translation initiation factor IF-3